MKDNNDRDNAWYIFLLIVPTAVLIAWVLLGSGCASRSSARDALRPHVLYIERFVNCIRDTPPPVVDIDWPDEDSIGNSIVHRSTKEKFQAAYADAIRWMAEAFRRCREVAAQKGETSVETQVE